MLKALILCGGKSTRMSGKDKAMIEVHGQAQYAHLFQLLTELNLPTLLSCNAQQMHSIPDQYPKVKDVYEAIGPMGGIISAMQAHPETDWLILACDLYLIDKASIAQLVEVAELSAELSTELSAEPPANFSGEIITFQKEGSLYPETTFTIYKKEIRPMMQEAVAQKQFSLQKILRKSKVQTLRPSSEKVLMNFNTEEALRKIQYYK